MKPTVLIKSIDEIVVNSYDPSREEKTKNLKTPLTMAKMTLCMVGSLAIRNFVDKLRNRGGGHRGSWNPPLYKNTPYDLACQKKALQFCTNLEQSLRKLHFERKHFELVLLEKLSWELATIY
jgi:hypothetical protein